MTGDGWVQLTEPVPGHRGGTDLLVASVHPGGDALTIGYRGGDCFVLAAADVPALERLLTRAQAHTQRPKEAR